MFCLNWFRFLFRYFFDFASTVGRSVVVYTTASLMFKMRMLSNTTSCHCVNYYVHANLNFVSEPRYTTANSLACLTYLI